VGIRCADHVTPSTHKSRHYFADSGGRSIGIVRLRTKATEFSLVRSDSVSVLRESFLGDPLVPSLGIILILQNSSMSNKYNIIPLKRVIDLF
jgi:hypothetical protein